MPGMTDPYLKIEWAKAHLQALNVRLLSFCTAENSYTATREDDLENQQHVMRLRLTEVPPEICLTVGDAVYNMRAALDQTVWNLARLNGIPEHTQFPVVEVLTSDSLKRFERQLSGVPDEAVREIKALQPYHRGADFKSHPLWRLNELCNLDKHRRIPADGSVLEAWLPGFSREDQTSGRVKFEATDECHMISVPLGMKDKLRVSPSAPVTVNFGGDASGISETGKTLVDIYNFVAEQVLPRFDCFFT